MVNRELCIAGARLLNFDIKDTQLKIHNDVRKGAQASRWFNSRYN